MCHPVHSYNIYIFRNSNRWYFEIFLQSVIEKPVDFDDGNWETVPTKGDKKKKVEQPTKKEKKQKQVKETEAELPQQTPAVVEDVEEPVIEVSPSFRAQDDLFQKYLCVRLNLKQLR